MSTIQTSVKSGNINWRKHALERMFQRDISRQDIKHCINTGTILKKYTDTNPYPAYLIEGADSNNLTMHVVLGFDEVEQMC